MDWTIDGLRAAGFVGFVPFVQVAKAAPEGPGVYAVVRAPSAPPAFLDVSPAGRFKGKDPSYSLATLQRNWIDGAEVLYLGKADRSEGTSRGLRARLTEYARFGAGDPIGHTGGKAIWHLVDRDELYVAWRVTADGDSAEAVETALLTAFLNDHRDRLPFANMKRPKGMRLHRPHR